MLILITAQPNNFNPVTPITWLYGGYLHQRGFGCPKSDTWRDWCDWIKLTDVCIKKVKEAYRCREWLPFKLYMYFLKKNLVYGCDCGDWLKMRGGVHVYNEQAWHICFWGCTDWLPSKQEYFSSKKCDWCDWIKVTGACSDEVGPSITCLCWCAREWWGEWLSSYPIKEL